MDLNPHPQAELPRRSFLADFLVLGALVSALFGTLEVGREWHQPFHREVEIHLSPIWLPYYTLLSLSRGVIAYLLSFVFTLFYARWALRPHRRALSHSPARHPAKRAVPRL